MLAFIGSSELVLAAFVGLLLFGGRLPEVMRQVGRAWITLRRALNELKRESGLDETLAEIERYGGTVLHPTRVYEPSFESHLVYATDPDGTRIEVIQTPNDPTRSP